MTLRPLQWVVDVETAVFHQPPSRVVAAGRHFFCVEKVDFIGWLSLIPDSKLPNMSYNGSVATFLQQETPGAANI